MLYGQLAIFYTCTPIECFMALLHAITYVFSLYKFIWMVCLEFMLQLCTMHADLDPSSTHLAPTISSQQTSSSTPLTPTIPSQMTSSSSYLAYQQTSSALLTSTPSPSPTPAVVSYTSTSNEGMKVSATGQMSM